MDTLVIQSHKGPYGVHFGDCLESLKAFSAQQAFFLIDSNVARIYSDILSPLLENGFVLAWEANEKNKSLEGIPRLLRQFLDAGLRRDSLLVGMGGGNIQDVAAFVASILFRGIDWYFYPTTLLAQTDACIGSKSSINVGGYKNQIGTFYPPKNVYLDPRFLKTLRPVDLASGFGEVMKAHCISGKDDFENLLEADKKNLLPLIRRSLEVKKRVVEEDEFDRKTRWILNYGHTFGHALESATDFRIPHGIAITIGMDLANFVSHQLGFLKEEVYKKARILLRGNDSGFERPSFSLDHFFGAMRKDKKTSKKMISLVLMRGLGDFFLHPCENFQTIEELCKKYFSKRSES